MKRRYGFVIVFLLIGMLVTTGCTSMEQTSAYVDELEYQYGPSVVWASESTAPSWWNQPPYETSDGAIYSVGVSRGYGEMKDAIEDARMDAAAQIAQHYGMNISMDYADVRTIDISGNQIDDSSDGYEAIKKSFQMMLDAVVTGIEYVDQVEILKREMGENKQYVRVRAKVARDKKDSMVEALKGIAAENQDTIKALLVKESDPIVKRQLNGLLDTYRMFLNL